MITRCGLNRLRQFATFLGHHIRASKANPKLLQALVRLDEVVYSGLPLGREEEVWAVQNGIKLHVSDVPVIAVELLLTERIPLIPKLYRTCLEAPKLAPC